MPFVTCCLLFFGSSPDSITLLVDFTFAFVYCWLRFTFTAFGFGCVYPRPVVYGYARGFITLPAVARFAFCVLRCVYTLLVFVALRLYTYRCRSPFPYVYLCLRLLHLRYGFTLFLVGYCVFAGVLLPVVLHGTTFALWVDCPLLVVTFCCGWFAAVVSVIWFRCGSVPVPSACGSVVTLPDVVTLLLRYFVNSRSYGSTFVVRCSASEYV